MTTDENQLNPFDEDIRLFEEADEAGYIMPEIPDLIPDIGEATGENWRDFDDVVTNSLWIINARSKEGVHNGHYHGNFVPQIPYQAIRRFTKPGDVVLDTFLGSGTTLIEARRLGRNGIGVELIETVAQNSEERILLQPSEYDTWQSIICGASSNKETIHRIQQALKLHERTQVQLLIMHPPYHDIVRFSDDPRDLCNAPTQEEFLKSFKKVVYGTYKLLEKDHFLVVVISDKYSNREWVPLGFYVMEAVKSAGYILKSIVVKNMEGNRAKRNLENLWRQRAFKGKYYIFKHEYVLFFQKTEHLANKLEYIIESVKAIDNQEELNLVEDTAFIAGESIDAIISDYTWITPPQCLALKQGRDIRAIVLDLTEMEEVTDEIGNQLENLISRLPGRDKIIDISVLVKSDHRTLLQKKHVPGISCIYADDEISIQHLAHSIYTIRKTLGSGQRAGRASGFDFSESLNTVIASHFEREQDYDWSPRRGIGFMFFKRDTEVPFNGKEKRNFHVGIVTKWVNGHENEKMPQIRDGYYDKGYTLIAIVGPNVNRWKDLIARRGNFANYYLFVEKGEERILGEILQQRSLMKSTENNNIEETKQNLIDFLVEQSLKSTNE